MLGIQSVLPKPLTIHAVLPGWQGTRLETQERWQKNVTRIYNY